MRSQSHGHVTTVLLFIPLIAVPLLAVFGVPRFPTLNPSPSSDVEASDADVRFASSGVGESARHSADDLFAPVEKPARKDDAGRAGSVELSPGSPHGAGHSTADWTPPPEAVEGWKVDAVAGRNAARTNPPRDSEGVTGPGVAVDLAGNGKSGGRESTVLAMANSDGRKLADSSAAMDDRGGERTLSPAELAVAAVDRIRGGAPEESVAETSASSDAAIAVDPGSDSIPAAADQPPATWAEAVSRLKALGIDDYRLEPGRNLSECHFSCVHRSREDAEVSHRYEAEAAEPLAAVCDVLAQIENQRNRQSRRTASRN